LDILIFVYNTRGGRAKMSKANVEIFTDAAQLSLAAAEQFIQISEAAIQTRGLCSVALAGGGTPQSLYRLLASEPFSEKVHWERIHFFWGDERCVPPDHPESNYRKACQALLDHVPVPVENIHRIPAERSPEQAAAEYEEDLLRFFSSLPGEEERSRASFDLALLGMGDDGHTASLFPGTAAVHEQQRWVAAQYVDKLAAWRITLTPALLNRSNGVIFLVSGGGKSWVLQKVLYGSYQPDRYPAQVIKPNSGGLRWLVDEAAAAYF
jgi:6-phosphogluconolactonase